MFLSCKSCHKDFKVFFLSSVRSRKFCSRQCYWESKKGTFSSWLQRGYIRPKTRVAKICVKCGQNFEVPKCRGQTANYCSKKCWSQRRPPQNRNCLYCQKIFIVRHCSGKKYCSRECSYKDLERFQHRQSRRSAICEFCQKEFTRPKSFFKVAKGRFCNHSCSAKWWSIFGLHGKDHPRWNGGGYPAVFYRDGWKPIKRMLLEKAQGRCQKCNQVSRKLDIHHLKPIRHCSSLKEANRLSNLKVVCRKCHLLLEKESRKKYPQLVFILSQWKPVDTSCK